MTQLNNSETNKLSKIEGQAIFDSVQLVKTDNIVLFQKNSILAFHLPDYKELLYARANLIEAYDLNNYTWSQ